MKKKSFKHKLTVGWREWLALPELCVPAIKAKVDTGARTSALHTFQIEAFEAQGKLRVRFGIHPLQRRTDIELFCFADVADERMVTDSGGHRELRYVIQTPVRIGTMQWPIEVSLTDRDTMFFRMLLGRSAIQRRFLVDSARSYQTGRSLAHSYS